MHLGRLTGLEGGMCTQILDDREREAVLVSLDGSLGVVLWLHTISPGLTCPETSFKIVFHNS